MDAVQREQIEDEIEHLDIILKAAENWAKQYTRDRKTYNKLIKNEAKWQRMLRSFFVRHARKAPAAINWDKYDAQLKEVNASRIDAAFDVDVMVKEAFLDGINEDFLKISLSTEYLSTATLLGAQAGESIYKIPLGITPASEMIQQLTTERIAWLVGKRVDKSGNIVDNPNAAYRISDKTREQIASSIKQSLDIGENRSEAAARLVEIIGDPARAERIAQTESVNAYGSGLRGFAKESGATGKEWQDVNASDECADYANQGIVPLDHEYEPGVYHPAAHTGCRCGERYVYKNEYDPDDE